MLTPAQRYFYDVNGYVLLEGIFSPAECRRFIELADRMDADETWPHRHPGYPRTPTRTLLARCAWYDPHMMAMALHPTLLPVIEEIVGGDVRLEEDHFMINYPGPEAGSEPPGVRDLGWHRGIGPNVGSFEADGHYHCMFAKTFIYLTDNGSELGTWVVPGSHRMNTPTTTLKEFADETLARQIPSRAGDVLILSETLIHAAPRLPAGTPPRYSLTYGYTPTFMQPWSGFDAPPEVLERVGPRERALLTGETRYGFRRGQF